MSAHSLPTVGAILDALGIPGVPESGKRPSGEPAEVMDQIRALHRNNAEQWDREDDARKDHWDDAKVAAAKRNIDRLNRARHGFIETIDRAILREVAPNEASPLVTETPGMAIDRLSVLMIRLDATEGRAASGTADASQYADRLPQLRSQLDTLEEAIATLMNDLEHGVRQFRAYESFKLYGPPNPEQIR